jgi:hypothetical protein
MYEDGSVALQKLAQGLGSQPDLGGYAGAIHADVGVADLLAAGAFGRGLPESTPAWPAIARLRDFQPQRLAG